MCPEESVRDAAKWRLREEELRERQQRLEALIEEEQERRDRERAEQEEQKRRLEARERAEELRLRRRGLEDEAEERAAALVRTLGELSSLDAEHRSVLSAAGDLEPGLPSLRQTLGQWLRVRFASLLGGPRESTDAYHGAPLAERDRLTRDE